MLRPTSPFALPTNGQPKGATQQIQSTLPLFTLPTNGLSKVATQQPQSAPPLFTLPTNGQPKVATQQTQSALPLFTLPQWAMVPTVVSTPKPSQTALAPKALFEASSQPTPIAFSNQGGVSSTVRQHIDGLYIGFSDLSLGGRMNRLQIVFSNLANLMQTIDQSDLPEAMKTLWFQHIQAAQSQVVGFGQGMLPGNLTAKELAALLSDDPSQPSSREAASARGKFEEASRVEVEQRLSQLEGILKGGNLAYEKGALRTAEASLLQLQELLAFTGTSAEAQGNLTALRTMIEEQRYVTPVASRKETLDGLFTAQTRLEETVFG